MELTEKKLRIIQRISSLNDELKIEQIYSFLKTYTSSSEDEIVSVINESVVDYKEGRTTDFEKLIDEIKHW